MNKTIIRALLAVVLCLSLLPIPGALALKASGTGTVRRGYFEDSGISFQVPNSFSLTGIENGKNADVIKLTGPKDVNGFTPNITVRISAEEIDLDNASLEDIEDYITDDLKGDNALNMVDERVKADGGDMLRRIFFYNTEDGRMGILYLYQMNRGGFGVRYEYQSYTAMRTLPDDLEALPQLITNFTIE